MKISTVEVAQVDKMNRQNFNMDEWQDFSIKAVLAHLVGCSSHELVQLCLDSIKEDE